MDEIDHAVEVESSRVQSAINAIQAQVGMVGEIGPENCRRCDDEIPMARRIAVPKSDLCVDCKSADERR